jgi:subtilisin family serine protease
MKRTVFLAIAVLTLMVAHASGQFYYGSDGPISLKIDSLKVTIKFDATISPSAKQELIESIGRIVGTVEDDHMVDGFVACTLSTRVNYDLFLDSLDNLDGIYLVEPYYLSENDLALVVGEGFCVAFDSTVTENEIDNINAAYKVVVDHELYAMPGVYLLRNTDSTGLRMLELANAYYDLDETVFSHPNFGVRVKPMSYKLYDCYSQYQLHIQKVIGEFNEKSVWDFAGLDHTVTVAVVDDGVTGHEDLPDARILNGYDFFDSDDDPTPGQAEEHGMACAGIIGASHTTDSLSGQQPSTGVISLNPNINILPVKVYSDAGYGGDVVTVAEAISYAWNNGADIISNSWGFRDPDYDFPALNQPLEMAFLFGRNGRGCPVIFAAGNAAQSFPGKVAYPAKLWCCFAVGATHLDDIRWYYSQYGSELDLVAPSGDVCLQGDVWSLDQMGELGVNPHVEERCLMPVSWNCPTFQNNDQDYNCHFGGTSAACPIVAGTAALLLARNPTLNSSAIYYILKNSAETNLDFGTITPPHSQYGYGRVDAFRAMLAICHGDANNDGNVNIGDAVHINNYIFKDGPAPQPDLLTGDANCDGTVNTGDVCYIVNYIFHGGPAPQICFEY